MNCVIGCKCNGFGYPLGVFTPIRFTAKESTHETHP